MNISPNSFGNAGRQRIVAAMLALVVGQRPDQESALNRRSYSDIRQALSKCESERSMARTATENPSLANRSDLRPLSAMLRISSDAAFVLT
jgi:hypothetical protein